MAYRGLGKPKEAEAIAMKLIEDFPEYLAAYDFIASLMEETGQLSDAQEILQRASVISPKNSERLQAIGNIAVRNDDLDTAESAYERVLKYRQGSSICSVEDYANLSRVLLSKGQVDSARKIAKDVLRDKQGEPHGALTAHVIESLCCSQEGLALKAKEALEKALALRDTLRDDTDKASQKITIDLAHACFSAGEEKIAEDLLSKVMAENHEDRTVLAQVQKVFAQIGKERSGQTLLAKVESEIVSLNNRGISAAQKGDLKSSVQMLIDAAEQVPNLQFLVNAAKAIFALLDETGWDSELAEQGLRYLKMAKEKDPLGLKVISTSELYHHVARKYGVNVWMGDRDLGAGESYTK
jgi:tetratricopeptide (TPR) repeat protein